MKNYNVVKQLVKSYYNSSIAMPPKNNIQTHPNFEGNRDVCHSRKEKEQTNTIEDIKERL